MASSLKKPKFVSTRVPLLNAALKEFVFRTSKKMREFNAPGTFTLFEKISVLKDFNHLFKRQFDQVFDYSGENRFSSELGAISIAFAEQNFPFNSVDNYSAIFKEGMTNMFDLFTLTFDQSLEDVSLNDLQNFKLALDVFTIFLNNISRVDMLAVHPEIISMLDTCRFYMDLFNRLAKQKTDELGLPEFVNVSGLRDRIVMITLRLLRCMTLYGIHGPHELLKILESLEGVDFRAHILSRPSLFTFAFVYKLEFILGIDQTPSLTLDRVLQRKVKVEELDDRSILGDFDQVVPFSKYISENFEPLNSSRPFLFINNIFPGIVRSLEAREFQSAVNIFSTVYKASLKFRVAISPEFLGTGEYLFSRLREEISEGRLKVSSNNLLSLLNYCQLKKNLSPLDWENLSFLLFRYYREVFLPKQDHSQFFKTLDILMLLLTDMDLRRVPGSVLEFLSEQVTETIVQSSVFVVDTHAFHIAFQLSIWAQNKTLMSNPGIRAFVEKMTEVFYLHFLRPDTSTRNIDHLLRTVMIFCEQRDVKELLFALVTQLENMSNQFIAPVLVFNLIHAFYRSGLIARYPFLLASTAKTMASFVRDQIPFYDETPTDLGPKISISKFSADTMANTIFENDNWFSSHLYATDYRYSKFVIDSVVPVMLGLFEKCRYLETLNTTNYTLSQRREFYRSNLLLALYSFFSFKPPGHSLTFVAVQGLTLSAISRLIAMEEFDLAISYIAFVLDNRRTAKEIADSVVHYAAVVMQNLVKRQKFFFANATEDRSALMLRLLRCLPFPQILSERFDALMLPHWSQGFKSLDLHGKVNVLHCAILCLADGDILRSLIDATIADFISQSLITEDLSLLTKNIATAKIFLESLVYITHFFKAYDLKADFERFEKIIRQLLTFVEQNSSFPTASAFDQLPGTVLLKNAVFEYCLENKMEMLNDKFFYSVPCQIYLPNIKTYIFIKNSEKFKQDLDRYLLYHSMAYWEGKRFILLDAQKCFTFEEARIAIKKVMEKDAVLELFAKKEERREKIARGEISVPSFDQIEEEPEKPPVAASDETPQPKKITLADRRNANFVPSDTFVSLRGSEKGSLHEWSEELPFEPTTEKAKRNSPSKDRNPKKETKTTSSSPKSSDKIKR